MGEIWLARDTSLDRMIALKVLRADVTQDEMRLTRFRQEARAASALNHPNVCTIHSLGETADGQQFIAMEHIAGETLRGRLKRTRLSPHDALDIIVQVASALTAAHAAGIVHRDLKPENVMLRPDGLIKVLDFGMAKLPPAPATTADATRSVAHTDVVMVVGTIAYMSPEQARGEQVDARTDIWSSGVMLYEMIAGRNPFAASSSSEVLAAILDREPGPLARFEPDVPPELQRIVTKALRKDREQRYQSMKELLLDLQALRSEGAKQPSTTGPSGAEAAVGQLARRWHVAALIACALVLLAGGGWWVLSRQSPAANEPPSVAVLPFTSIGAGDTYFADGITEAVTTELGRVGGLRVIASNTAFGYRNKTIRDVVRDLGVAHVVTGSVQRADDNVRIDVRLVNTRDEVASWSEHYSRKLTDALSVQDEISGRIAGRISERFRPSSGKPSLATNNPQAYDAYLRGLWHLKGRADSSDHRMVPGSARRLQAIEELERAVEHDPDFALAHAALASAYTQRFFYDTPDAALEQKGFLHIKSALAINPELAEAHLAHAQLTWNLRHGFPHADAIGHLRRALSFNPNLVEAYVELGKVYFHIGLTEEAVEANRRAQWLDPADGASFLRGVLALVDAGRLEDVQNEVDRNRARLGVYPLCEALVALGRVKEAATVLSGVTAEESDIAGADRGPQFEAYRAVVFALLGQHEDARRMLDDAMPRAENAAGLSHVHHAQFHIGAALGLLGRKDVAVRWLKQAANEGYPSYPRFSTDRSLDPLRGHAGFEALVDGLRQRHALWRKTL
jgi:TolB-like protein/tRNA A-37 threonylcarbamoyl transferase component Bud32